MLDYKIGGKEDKQPLVVWLDKNKSGCVDLKVTIGSNTGTMMTLSRDGEFYLNNSLSSKFGIKLNDYHEPIVNSLENDDDDDDDSWIDDVLFDEDDEDDWDDDDDEGCGGCGDCDACDELNDWPDDWDEDDDDDDDDGF